MTMKYTLKPLFFLLAGFLASLGAMAQASVDINVDVKHIVGDQSEFERKKYITMHSDLPIRYAPANMLW